MITVSNCFVTKSYRLKRVHCRLLFLYIYTIYIVVLSEDNDREDKKTDNETDKKTNKKTDKKYISFGFSRKNKDIKEHTKFTPSEDDDEYQERLQTNK